ncbi:MAG: tripartite tricarboxylate transporter substrate-binding protein [Beijerinckiaceae bacterium]|nr:tripartite tricarboxylate transporter substrate-binding protein [Beijerinckiaceae bacterium]
MTLKLFRAAAVGAIATLIVAPASAQSPADFYKGRTVSIVVGSSAGGGFDLYARMIGRHMQRHMPGAPNIVVSNMPGAGSIRLAQHIYAVAPKDGTVIGAVFAGAIMDPLLGARTNKVEYDAAKFTYIGSANSEAYVCLARKDAKAQTFADALNTEIVLGASASGGSTLDFPTLLRNVLGAKFKIVNGYPGTNEISMAVESGEVQGACGYAWSTVQSRRRHWLTDNLVNILVQEVPEPYAEMTKMGIPVAQEFAKTDEQRRILDLVYAQLRFGRPYIASPGIPADRVATLRKAFVDTLNDPELRKEADKLQVDIDVLEGGAMQKFVAELYTTPADIVEKTRAALRPK